MATKRVTRKLIKIASVILGIILALLVAFHFWFINHAESLVEDLVNKQSKGKLHLDIGKFRFNWFNRKMELKQAVFYSTDTLTAPTAYRFSVQQINIQVERILPLIFEKRFLIDSIQLISPDVSVTKLRSKDSASVRDTSLSLPQEMGRIYNSIQDALRVLQVDRFQIDNGKFSLINRTRPEEKPIVITRLHFFLDNLQVDTARSDTRQKILFSDNVALQTTHQDIVFPDGRHRLSFSNFRINIRNRLAEFDSCTIMATRGDSTNNSFRIFFDKLRMTNIDFDTLYHTEVIKADSVYCINPRFQLNVDLPKRTGPIQPPKLDELIQQLTGSMQLAFVIVQNGSFDINTMREGRPSSFTSDHNNFELQNLRIRENAPRPLTVERFAMAIRNYENFLRDSAYAIQFDSILLNNNRISLSNFSYQEMEKNKVVNSLSMPLFELQGLSWDDLLFGQQLNAESVTLYRPVINYKADKNKQQRSQDVFQILAGIGAILQLNNMNIVDGQVNLFLPHNTRLQLEGATMSVKGKELVGSRKLISISRSVTDLRFKKGVFTSNDLTAELDEVQFSGEKGGLQAATLHIRDKKELLADAQQVSIRSMVIDDRLQQANIDGVRWQKAGIRLLLTEGTPGGAASFRLSDINGANTSVTLLKGNQTISVSLKNISAREIILLKGRQPQVTGLAASGNDLSIINDAFKLQVKQLDLADQRSSTLRNISYTSYAQQDSVLVNIPELTIIPNINVLMGGKLQTDALSLFQPQIDIHLSDAGTASPGSKKPVEMAIGKLLIRQPVIRFLNTNHNGTSVLEWNGKESDNQLELTNFKLGRDSFSASQLRLGLDHFLFTNSKGKTFRAGNGQVNAVIDRPAMQRNDAGSWDWRGIVASLAMRNFVIDSLGRKNGTLKIDSARLNDLAISSSLIINLRELVSRNTRFNLQQVTGSYHNTSDQFRWFNAGYDKKTRHFAVDSFSYHPTLDKDAFLKAQTYQVDYMTAKTGKIDIGTFDLQRYIKDSILDLGLVTIDNGHMESYRDKRLPRPPGLVRSLPVDLLKKIATRLTIDTVRINNSLIEYGEINEKTGSEGVITVNRLNGRITRLRNFDISKTDSLYIEASAYLQDTILTQLQVKESYADSLSGFLMTAQMGPTDLTILNPVLVPLASAELRSGKLDTMSLSATGGEYVATGEMNMRYHDLKIRVVRPGKHRKSFTNGLLTFFVNTLVKNENKNRGGAIFFRRLRDRSAINYLVKIALNGVSSSVGVKNNKKKIRRFNRNKS